QQGQTARGRLNAASRSGRVWADTPTDWRPMKRSCIRMASPARDGPTMRNENPFACRACVRRAKGSDGAIHQSHWDCPGHGQDGMINVVYNIKRVSARIGSTKNERGYQLLPDSLRHIAAIAQNAVDGQADPGQ